MSNKKKRPGDKLFLVLGVDPSRYEIKDSRLMKPVCHQQYKNGSLIGSMLIQDLDSVALGRNRKVAYFVPNNIALLLSTSDKALIAAKIIYNKKLSNSEIELYFEKMDGDRKENIQEVSSLVCDYLENIQTSIVFGYTALEAFVNLSIPNNYQYVTDKNGKGISEIYDKKAIERWLPLKTKIKNILTDIYQTPKVDNQKWWGHFTNLENYRNDIIHQKSITHTEFYKSYFKKGIFDICNSPVKAIRYFHDCHAEKNKTNPIWPWMEDASTMPINVSYDASKFEVVGNLYEGIKKKV